MDTKELKLASHWTSLSIKAWKSTAKLLAFVAVIGLSCLYTGCTSYSGCITLEDRVVRRYEQNIIMSTDSKGKVFWKVIKHGFFDVVTFATCEFWYGHVRKTYHRVTYSDIVDKRNTTNGKAIEQIQCLDSFLGIKFNEAMPTNSPDFFDVKRDYKDPCKYEFHTKRRFSDADYKFYVYVTPTSQEVWRVEAVADFLSYDDLQLAHKLDREDPEFVSNTSGTGYGSGNSVYYSGTTVIENTKRYTSSIRANRLAKAKKETREVLRNICLKYGRSHVRGEIKFKDGKIVSVTQARYEGKDFLEPKVIVAAYDSNVARILEQEKKLKREQQEQKKSYDARSAF